MRERIIEIIRDACALKEDNITFETNLGDISLDSLTFIEVIVRIEQEFGVEFDDEDLNIDDWGTIGDVIHYVEGKINGI